MTITEIKDKRVKLSPRSITVKDEYDKTRGVVKAVRWNELPPREHFNFRNIMTASGLWGSNSELLEQVYVVNGKIYFLWNKRYEENYHKYFETFEYETKQFVKRKVICELARQYMDVIDCYIVK